MMDIQSLSTEEVIEIQRKTLPNSGEPDINKLEGALFRVQTLRDYEGCEDVFKFAAMYLIAIAKSHAFNDANKRTAFQATSIFLILNGFELNASFELV
ncbi:type II toxin-antitoxin system death-on-curing family toxin, partial [Xenorhabdus bovienii]